MYCVSDWNWIEWRMISCELSARKIEQTKTWLMIIITQYTPWYFLIHFWIHFWKHFWIHFVWPMLKNRWILISFDLFLISFDLTHKFQWVCSQNVVHIRNLFFSFLFLRQFWLFFIESQTKISTFYWAYRWKSQLYFWLLRLFWSLKYDKFLNWNALNPMS
jgi:hypothetical protein